MAIGARRRRAVGAAIGGQIMAAAGCGEHLWRGDLRPVP
jgi:hypothetical protein